MFAQQSLVRRFCASMVARMVVGVQAHSEFLTVYHELWLVHSESAKVNVVQSDSVVWN